MLSNLHVKNIALIHEIDISFEKGLNVITGETGAGKSLLLGSVNLALGGKFSQEMLREGADNALVELVFTVDDERTAKKLTQMGYPPEDGCMIISRKLSGGRTISRVNGETCTASQLKEISEQLINIHGQRENQTLLKKEKQLEVLDLYGKNGLETKLKETENAYNNYIKAKKRFAEYSMDEEKRLRELSMLEYEVNEIEEAHLKEGEEEELEKRYRIMKNSRNIVEALTKVHEFTGYDLGAGDMVGRAIQEIGTVSEYDTTLKEIADSLADVDAILGDINRAAASYLGDYTFSEQEFIDMEERLDKIRSLQSKYGSTVSKIESYREQALSRIEFLTNYEEERVKAEKELEDSTNMLEEKCEELSKARKKEAKNFSEAVKKQMEELNFAQAVIDIEFTRASSYRKNGFDDIEIMISTNPGEPVRPLAKVASGGELSRIMLAIRNILADEENTGTLIFDEIDSGISGRTAQKVSEKMASIASGHQILCVSHLAQIAAMADKHFLIEKSVSDNKTQTVVRPLDKNEEIEELARILGGSKITDAVYSNAVEMKQLASDYKNK